MTDHPPPNRHTQLHRRGGLRELARTLEGQRRSRRSSPSSEPSLRRPRLAAAAIGVVALIVLFALVWPRGREMLQAAAVLKLVANQPVPESLRWTVTDHVAVDDITFPGSYGPVRARMYTPVEHPDAPALVVLHGVHYLGIDEPRLIAFATAMSACGLRVLTPELPDIKDYHIGPNSIATIGESAEWLAAHIGGRPVGVMGLSFSGGLALLAAADPQFQPSIRFVFAVGAEDQMQRVAAFYRTGQATAPNGTELLLPPNEYGPLVLEYENLEDFVPPSDLAPLRAVLRAHLDEDAPDSAAEKAALAHLNPQQAGEARALMAIDAPTTRALLAKAEAKHVTDMARVSPHGHLGHLSVPVYLLHGAADNVIPSSETLWMESELPTTTLKAALISPVLSHLDLDGAAPGVLDNLRLVRFFAMILRAAESSSSN